MADTNQASDAAKKRAEDLGVDISLVDGTGSGGNITVADVEQAAKEAAASDGSAGANAGTNAGTEAEVEASYAAKVNPALDYQSVVVNLGGERREIKTGDPLTESELEELREIKTGSGLQYVVKGKQLS